MPLTYNPAVFATSEIDAARRIILTEAQARDTDTRWALETPYLVGQLAEQLRLGSDDLLVDYGYGIGRLAKGLIEKTGCIVLGVDSSAEMRALAPAYVGSQRFSAVSRQTFQAMARHGLRADAAISVWVLQHCKSPGDDIGLLAAALPPRAPLAIVNSFYRAVPTLENGWSSDRIDIRETVRGWFDEVREIPLDAEAMATDVATQSFFTISERRGGQADDRAWLGRDIRQRAV